MKSIGVLILASFLLFSCAHVISKESREGALTDIPFKAVRKDIEKYKGSTFIWGGFIVAIKTTDEGTEIEIVQNPLDKYGDIIDPDFSYGRFIALHTRELDELIYEPDRFVTVAGRLAGARTVTRKERKYVYPLLQVTEIFLWKEETIYYVPDYWYGGYPYGTRHFIRRPYYRKAPYYRTYPIGVYRY
jgi:outer membrane lipoprotein